MRALQYVPSRRDPPRSHRRCPSEMLERVREGHPLKAVHVKHCMILCMFDHHRGWLQPTVLELQCQPECFSIYTVCG